VKIRYSLVQPCVLRALADVLTFGAECHPPNGEGWRTLSPAEHYDALMRHLEDWRRDVRTDIETGMHPLVHALARLHFIAALVLDDAAKAKAKATRKTPTPKGKRR
jgi:hypothetical protein